MRTARRAAPGVVPSNVYPADIEEGSPWVSECEQQGPHRLRQRREAPESSVQLGELLVTGSCRQGGDS